LKSKKSFLVSIAILLLFGYFLYEYRVFENLREIFKKLSPEYLLLSLLFYSLTYFLRAERFFLAFKRRIGRLELVAVMAVHTFFNNLLPMRAGELSLPLILKRLFGVEFQSSGGVLLFMRVLDLLSLSFLFSLSTVALALSKGEAPLLYLSFIIFFVLVVASLFLFKLLRFLSKRWIVFEGLFLIAKELSAFRALLKLFLQSLGIWLLKFFSFYFILKAAGLSFGFFETVFVSTFGEITSVLPLHSFGGFGTYEAGLVGGFKLLGLKTSYALTVAFYFHILLLAMSALLALAGWVYLSVRFKRGGR